ncbi:purine and uridine phosphorylase [Penicillium mononematosum]|uniref:purine and uridine phosphorylase n=1 Tax=Penicillium mononematosum TaxID=268346 RepID=UPI0025485FA3|nr:purine and uridine phosphorylase [Penicillium mononematosum]KAJ6185367.1 purine and uridine phosphorylase [Penicillium mononematosum]
MERSFPDHDYTNRGLWNTYMPHALDLIKRVDLQRSKQGPNPVYKASRCLLADGRAREASFWLSELNDLLEGSLAKEDPRRLSLQHFLAVAYRGSGQVGKAIKLLKHAVTPQEKSLAEEHLQRLMALQALAVAYRK